LQKQLVVLGCSKDKISSEGELPALMRYDGTMYKIFQKHLREYHWPKNISIAILSAKYGLIGSTSTIEDYDLMMDEDRANELRESTTETLSKWIDGYSKVDLILSKNYLSALDLKSNKLKDKANIIEGGIGVKRGYFSKLLKSSSSVQKRKEILNSEPRPLYFLPDWDDTLDKDFDFIKDRFSKKGKKERVEQGLEIHCIEVMRPMKVADGILISLAQYQTTKGTFKKIRPTDIKSLAPITVREKYALDEKQLVFGDCGAYTYVNQPKPTITSQEVAAMYQLLGFDLGASIDHIPVAEIRVNGKIQHLSDYQRQERVEITRENAKDFIEICKKRKYSFAPVGIIQGLTPKSYGIQLIEYVEMGYKHIALGGLVPKSDAEIIEIIVQVNKAREKLSRKINASLWIHLFGVFRPKIQDMVRQSNISSFDSATYFRKSWLRADQNYMGADGKWYSAIRVPTTKDARTVKKLEQLGYNRLRLKKLEFKALHALHQYDKGLCDIDTVLKTVMDYDSLLLRGIDVSKLRRKYRETLESRIWEKCNCPVCKNIGIDVVIFRGYNRNKRRGIHNTFHLYNYVKDLKDE
jgi:queuine/archaeosine tRNA-ribosyltransferase